jgi:hypothetical protein
MTHLRREDWTVRGGLDHSECVQLIQLWHYAKGAPNTSTARHGLYRTEDGPILALCHGVAMWIPPTRTAAEAVAGDRWQGVLALTRFVLEPGLPTNAASFLLSRSRRLIDRTRWPVLLTYADTAEGHTGAIYRADNWICDGPVPAGDTWVDDHGRQAGRKRGGRTLTAAAMRAAGYYRKSPAPKIRFRHEVHT